MNHAAHYARGCELAAEADELLANSDKPGFDTEYCLRRAEVAAQMATARFKGAWVACLEADVDAAQRLVEDAKQAKAFPDLHITRMKDRP